MNDSDTPVLNRDGSPADPRRPRTPHSGVCASVPTTSACIRR